MSGVEDLHPYGSDFDRFLYAWVGQDRNGHGVTVLSTLARLGLDPWREAAELAARGREVARGRLDKLLSGFRDVPALADDHGAVARQLSLLLPEQRAIHAPQPAGSARTRGATASGWSVMALLMILLVVVQALLFGGAGSGE